MCYMENEVKVINVEDYDESMDKYYRRVDFLGDKVLLSPPTSLGHSRVVMNFCIMMDIITSFYIIGYSAVPGIGVYLDEESRNLDRGLYPDVSICCDKYPNKVPVLVCEVLHYLTAKYDIEDKMDIYKKAGVSEYWVIDPTVYKVLVCDFVSGREKVFSVGDICKSFIFEELYFPLENLFSTNTTYIGITPRVCISMDKTFIGNNNKSFGYSDESHKIDLF